MRIEIINYKGKDILFIDYRGLSGDEVTENMKLANKKLVEMGENVLFIADFNDTFLNKGTMDLVKSEEMRNIVTKHTKKSAVLGVTGIKKILLNTYNKVMGSNTRAFNTLEEAKEWLIS